MSYITLHTLNPSLFNSIESKHFQNLSVSQKCCIFKACSVPLEYQDKGGKLRSEELLRQLREHLVECGQEEKQEAGNPPLPHSDLITNVTPLSESVPS